MMRLSPTRCSTNRISHSWLTVSKGVRRGRKVEQPIAVGCAGRFKFFELLAQRIERVRLFRVGLDGRDAFEQTPRGWLVHGTSGEGSQAVYQAVAQCFVRRA